MHLPGLTAATRFLVDSDPGRLRLRSATATTLSLVLGMVALLGFTRVADQPITVAMLGTIVAMQSSAAVKDRQQHSRVVTTLLFFFPAVAAVSLAALLSPLGVDPLERATETMILDVMGSATVPPGPLRGALRALSTLDLALAKATARA